MLPSIYNIAYRYLCERKCKNMTKHLFMAMGLFHADQLKRKVVVISKRGRKPNYEGCK
jgi:hypothetical protein